MIEFLEHNTQYKGEEYSAIWLKLVHQAYLNKQKIQIIENEADSNLSIHMRFENTFLEHETQHSDSQIALQLEDDDLEIRNLCN